jgi:hypothetical protein
MTISLVCLPPRWRAAGRNRRSGGSGKGPVIDATGATRSTSNGARETIYGERGAGDAAGVGLPPDRRSGLLSSGDGEFVDLPVSDFFITAAMESGLRLSVSATPRRSKKKNHY